MNPILKAFLKFCTTKNLCKNNNIIYIKNEENFMKNLVAPAPKLFDAKMAHNETDSAEKSWMH